MSNGVYASCGAFFAYAPATCIAHLITLVAPLWNIWVVIRNRARTTLVVSDTKAMVSLLNINELSLSVLFEPNLWHKFSVLSIKEAFVDNKTSCHYVLLDIKKPLVEIVVCRPLSTSVLDSDI
jgi:hypothetical protein